MESVSWVTEGFLMEHEWVTETNVLLEVFHAAYLSLFGRVLQSARVCCRRCATFDLSLHRHFVQGGCEGALWRAGVALH